MHCVVVELVAPPSAFVDLTELNGISSARVRQLQGGDRRSQRNGYGVMQWVVVFDDVAVVMD